MQDLVNVKNNQVTTNSLTVAEVFGKRHRDVLRAIKLLKCSPDFNARNFALVEYRDEKGEKRTCYDITRDGWTFLVMGFTGAKAAEWKEKYIAAFNAMEQALKSQVPVPLDAKAIGGIVKNCCAVAVREELERAATDMVYADKFKQLAKAAIADVIFSEDYYGSLKKLIKPWVKDAASASLGQSIDAYIKAEMDERVKYFVGFVFKNYPKMSQEMKEYLITYGIVNYGKYSEYTRERDFRGICETIWRQEQKDPEARFAM